MKSSESTIINLKFIIEKCLFENSRKIQLKEVIKNKDEN